ncbi:hypothetical protein AAJ76_6400020050 [Vairimorpha ceranae]|uniref:Uncharacterized protein n=1 Tax=Vairimorpha ceranae TaxID=40302 RepID=A0A0F9WNC5_9MICR|nr:hypothetical protein AAJ76_6400020050 [Vairimorpha ceranae]KKO74513.1 hypothetical protein AAJ76_6400020050 [Vairimorpha ceranae]
MICCTQQCKLQKVFILCFVTKRLLSIFQVKYKAKNAYFFKRREKNL